LDEQGCGVRLPLGLAARVGRLKVAPALAGGPGFHLSDEALQDLRVLPAREALLPLRQDPCRGPPDDGHRRR
jgi:hypothetical protein